MPTIEPLDDGDDVGGPLKPIAQFSEPAPAVPESAPRPASAPQTAPAPAARTVAPRPAPVPAGGPRPVVHAPVVVPPAGKNRVRTNLDGKVLSIKPDAGKAAAPQTQGRDGSAAPQAAQPAYAEPFTDDDLRGAWEGYIASHGHEQLLTNTMRAHPPTRQDQLSADLHMDVESQIQADLIAESMAAVLGYLRQTLRNGTVTLTTHIIEGLNSPSTWNEKEVLGDMIRRHPVLRRYIEGLDLTLG